VTNRLYYNNSNTIEFEALLTEATQIEGHPAAILDVTYFYPTSGGQPHDLGTLNDVRVLDVQMRPEDGAILHILEQPLGLGPVTGQIDWKRRFDHMQQHSGQHILSRAFEDLHSAQTIGFHLSDNSVTIDLDHADVALDAVEDLCNQVVFDDRPVKAWFPESDELASLKLRKISDKAGDNVRVIDIGSFDVCACGGTHVNRTGEIGMIKIVRAEKLKKGLRVEFRCGGRALSDYREKNRLLLDLAASLTLGYRDVSGAFGRLTDENKALSKELKTAKETLLRFEADELWMTAQSDSSPVIIAQVWEGRPAGDLSTVARHLSGKMGILAFLGLAGEKAMLVYAASPDTGLDASALLKSSLEKIGARGGGGSPTVAQGGGFSASLQELQNILAQAKADLP
jgi:alanyl-tRNA synthetase